MRIALSCDTLLHHDTKSAARSAANRTALEVGNGQRFEPRTCVCGHGFTVSRVTRWERKQRGQRQRDLVAA